MQWDEVKNRWEQLKGDVRKNWEKLSDEDVDRIAGDRAELEKLLCDRYGIRPGIARAQVRTWQHEVI